MARRCSICDHPQRAGIDRALVTNDAGYRSVAQRFGISAPALFRHRNNHLPVTLAQGLESKQEGADSGAPPTPAHAVELARHRQTLEGRDERHAIDVMQQLRAINAACLEVLTKARAADNHSTLLRAVDRIHRQIELQARLLGEIQDGATVNVAILPEWHGVRQVVVQALHPYPEARLAVVEALQAAAPDGLPRRTS